MSRGSRSPRSRSKALLQPFVPLLLGWSGNSDMPTLTSVELQDVKLVSLAGKALPSAFYINELLMNLLHKHDVHEEIFGLYESVIHLLQQGHDIEPVLRLFERQLLEGIGFGLSLNRSAKSGLAVVVEKDYAYYLEHGPVELESVFDESYIAKISGKSLLDLQNNTLESEQSLRDAKRLMRSILNYYLGGRPLKSRELFR